MTNARNLRLVFICLFLASAFSIILATRAAADQMPAAMQEGDVKYITGGIGEGETKAMESAKKDYNLTILNANRKGQYLSDTHITIANRNGEEMVNADADPLFYAKLPAGKYVVQATNGDETKKKVINVNDTHPANLTFSWQSL